MFRILTDHFEQAVILLRVCRTSFFLISLSLSFCLNCFFLVITVSGMPQFFISLLYRFWLNGLLFREIMTACLDDYAEPSPSFVSEGRLWCSLCTWINWENYPAPGCDLRVLICVKRKIPTSFAQRGWRGIIFLITLLFRIWNNACTSSAGSVRKHIVRILISFSSSSL